MACLYLVPEKCTYVIGEWLVCILVSDKICETYKNVEKYVFFYPGICLFHLRSKQNGDIPLVYRPSPPPPTHAQGKKSPLIHPLSISRTFSNLK